MPGNANNGRRFPSPEEEVANSDSTPSSKGAEQTTGDSGHQVLLNELATLRRSEAVLRDFVEASTIGLHWVGADGAILWVNQAELDLLGYSREEYVGRNIAEFHADESVINDILGRLSRGETLRDYSARLRHHDGSCFTLPAPGTLGDLGKNTVTAPGYVSTDFSLSKDTKIFERLNTQFRAEIFNIFNHANFGIPALNAFTAVNGSLTAGSTGSFGNAANAGQITSIVGTSRQIQLALKFLF
jgi:PAS domain S-box-containing protein